MKGSHFRLETLVLGILLIGYLTAETEKDFEFAGEKDSFRDDEDFVADQEGSGDIEGSGGGFPEPSGEPALYRGKVNITSLQFTAEIEGARASRTINQLPLTFQLQTAIQNLVSGLPGTIRIRIVDYEPGSLMVVFDVESDGQTSQEEIEQMLKDALTSGSIGSFRASPDGFQFALIRTTDGGTCPAEVGREFFNLTNTDTDSSNWANLMVNNAFPCNGYITDLSVYIVRSGEVYIGLFRQVSETDFFLVAYVKLPPLPRGPQKYSLPNPVLVQAGDFIGVFYEQADTGGVIASKAEQFENQYMSANARDFLSRQQFTLSSFQSRQQSRTFAVQATMNYDNVPEVVGGPSEAPRTCATDEWMCSNGDCIPANYRCDDQQDCEDGSDEEACSLCRADEYECVNSRQCIPQQFVCNAINDCGDNSDEVNCGPRPVNVNSYRDSSYGTEYLLSWTRPDPGSSDITRYDIKWREVMVQSDRQPDGNYIISRPLSIFSSAVVAPSDERFQLRNLEPATYYQVEITASNRFGQSAPQAFIFKTANQGCNPGEFQCTDGECIDLAYKCDNSPDCPDGSDEDDCSSPTICPEGQLACPQPDGQIKCVAERDGCACRETEFQCLDGRGCISFEALCDGKIDCTDLSDESNCECVDGEFQCVSDRKCIDGARRCDAVSDCRDGSDEDGCACPQGSFTCRNTPTQACVDNSLVCDGVNDCSDGSDEEDCGCPSGQWQCRDTRCVPDRFRCDGRPQCEDGSDEDNCPTPEPPSCPPSDFQCVTGSPLECIDLRLFCDGVPDCRDGSDERDCPGCRRDQFTCQSDGQCLPESSRCNGVVECSDRSDELGCVCTDDQFECGDGLCIDVRRRCDRRVDCTDRSDELACPCRSGEFQCVNGNCIPDSGRCNGRAECSDRSDEANCPGGGSGRGRCRVGYWQCGTGHCLQDYRVCDGISNCPDGSDERDCSLQCSDEEMECAVDNKCIRPDQICDRVYDCSDQSDEFNCQRCRSDEFQCESDRSCISQVGRCNGVKECSDGSDEMNCPTRPTISVAVSPQTLRIRAGAEALITCMASGLPANARIEWTRGSQGLPMQSAVELGKLMIPVAKPMDSGIYTCKVVGVAGDYSQSARLEVVAIEPPVDPDISGPCGRDEAVCQNGQCIRREYRCDGEKDCADGSDEPPDCYNNICEPNEFQCPDGQCVMKIWRCDGENDCSDGFDESACAPKDPNEACGYDEFQCVSGDQCIPLAYQCDQEIDCLDRSDEIGCSPPIITVPPVAEIEVELGATFTIICEAVGVPTPLIVWRLNWGNIPTGDRVSTVSSEGRGVLTVGDARYEDAGAYTCEAINNRGSIFAIPDALVIVRRNINFEMVADSKYCNLYSFSTV